jgi:hypothetical protein
LIVVSAEGAVLALMTSGVDAHLIQKAHPGSRTYRCAPNSTDVTLVTSGAAPAEVGRGGRSDTQA